MKAFIDAFGQMPGMEGNMLETALQGKKLEDLIPEDTTIGQWLKAANQALKDGKPILDLTPESPGCKVDQPRPAAH
jgi:hypothetical protein